VVASLDTDRLLAVTPRGPLAGGRLSGLVEQLPWPESLIHAADRVTVTSEATAA
jgi:hypothetical protein